MAKADNDPMLDFPLLSGTQLRDATQDDLFIEDKLDEEMEAVFSRIGKKTLKELFEAEPANAMRVVAYIAQSCFLEQKRVAASRGEAPGWGQTLSQEARSRLLQEIGASLNG